MTAYCIKLSVGGFIQLTKLSNSSRNFKKVGPFYKITESLGSSLGISNFYKIIESLGSSLGISKLLQNHRISRLLPRDFKPPQKPSEMPHYTLESHGIYIRQILLHVKYSRENFTPTRPAENQYLPHS